MKKRNPIVFLTRTAILLSLALTFQIWLRTFAQPIVGPMVNFILIFSALFVGTTSGVLIGGATPLVAFMVGITPIFPVVPFLMIGNALFVVLFNLTRNKATLYPEYSALLLAAISKYVFLTLSARYLLVLLVPNLPPQLVAALSLPQLYTALFGGTMAILLSKIVEKAIKDVGHKL